MSDRDDGERPTARGDIRAYLADFETRVTRLQERADETQEVLTAISASATSDLGEVTVTVGAGGGLTGVRFGPEARRTSPQSLEEMIMAMYRKAVQDAAGQAKDALTGLLGAGTPAMANFEESLRRRGEGGER